MAALGSAESWYVDLDRMAQDDAVLQRVYAALRRELSRDARHRTRRVHVYPSRRCTYTISKERIFVKVRADGDEKFLPDCAIRHILLHELAHTINPTEGHGRGFRHWLRWLSRDGGVDACPDRIPRRYNPCH